MLARIPFGLTTGPIEGAEILVAGCRKETVASEMRSNVLKYRDTLMTACNVQPSPRQKRRLNENAWCVREFERKEYTYDATEGRQ